MMDLVPTRKCGHVNWHHLPAIKVQFCISCGFCLSYEGALAGLPYSPNVYFGVQEQPENGSTFTIQLPADDGNRYEYRPLNHDQTFELRVLVLEPGQFHDPLHGNLDHVNLQQYPLYDAVSYTWADPSGDDALASRLFCGAEGRYIAITANCAAALRRLRLPDRTRRLWVDAICIDQSNFGERNHQVHNLVLTFRNAQQVVIYLGEGDERTQRLLEYMEKDLGGDIPNIADFVSFFRQRWFHRVWVLQEIAAAKTLKMVYGSTTRSWEYVISQVKLLQHVLKDEAKSQLPLPPVLSFALRTNGAAAQSTSGKYDMLEMLHISRSCSCKDARDKVYAIMGLVSSSSPMPALVIDYSPSTTAASVYTALASAHIQSTQSLHTLSYVQGDSQMDISSWVPDWTKPALPLLPRILPKPLNSDSFSSFLMEDFEYGLPAETLIVRGRKLGTVWPESVFFHKIVPEDNDAEPIDELGASLEPEAVFRLETLSEVMARPAKPAQGDDSRESADWLSKSPRNVRRQICPHRAEFWQSFAPYLQHSSATRLSDVECLSDIPSAFGGMCENCLKFDDFQWERMKQVRGLQHRTREDILSWNYTQMKELVCGCAKDSYASQQTVKGKKAETDLFESFGIRDKVVDLSSPHFLMKEREEFSQVVQQFGRGRRLFATEHSLGLGPETIQEGDEVWMLSDAQVPMILRRHRRGPYELEYRLVGECYLHAALRINDQCAFCGISLPRAPFWFQLSDETMWEFQLPESPALEVPIRLW